MLRLFPAHRIKMENVQSLPNSVLYFGELKGILTGEDGAVISLHMDSQQSGEYVMKISDQTVWIDSGERTPSIPSDLAAGERLYVFHSPVSTRSMPPQSAAFAVVRSIPQDVGCAMYHKVEAAVEREGKLQITTDNGGLFLYADQETALSTYTGNSLDRLEDIKAGAYIMAWYDAVALSYPGQAYAQHIMLLDREAASEPLTRSALIGLLHEAQGKPVVNFLMNYSDVDQSAPYAEAIRWASSERIISGYGDGTFKPANSLTGFAFAKMLLGALGYKSDLEGFTGTGWTMNVAKLGNAAGLFNRLSFNGAEAVNREEACQLALNTLKATMVTTERTGQDITIPGGIEISGTRTYTERTTDRYNYTTGSAPVSGEDKNLQLCEYLYGNDLTLTDDEDGLGRPASLWQYKGEDVVKTAKASWKSMVINPDDAATIGNVATSKDYFDLKASNVDASVEYKLNGDDKTTSEALKSGDVVELFRNDSNKVTDVIVTRYALAQVSKVDDDVSSADAKKGTSCYVSLKALNGTSMGNYNDNDFAGFNAADYTEDTFVAIAQNGESEIVASHAVKVVEGKVTAYKSGKVITLDGDKYNLVNGLAAGSVTSFDFDNSEFALYMTENDYVLAIDGVEGVKLDDVYYVHSAYYTKSGNGNTNFYAQVVDMEGVEDEIQIEATTYVNTFGLDEAQANSFGAVQKLYTFTDKDNKSGANNANGDAVGNGTHIDPVPDPKANNGKFSAKKYVGSADFEVASAGSDALDTLAAEVNSSSKTVKVTTGGFGAGDAVKSAYINENTKFVLIGVNDEDGDGADDAELDISTSVGSAKIANGKKLFVIASKEGSSYEAAAVIVADTGVSEGVSSDKVLYLTGAATNEVKGGYEATVYFMDGTNETVTIDAAGDKGLQR